MARVKFTALQAVAAVATAVMVMMTSTNNQPASFPSFFASATTCTGTANAPSSGMKTLSGHSYQVRAACSLNGVMYAFPGTVDWSLDSPDIKVWTWALNPDGDYSPTISTMSGIDTVANGYVEDCVSDSLNNKIYLVYREAGAGVGLVSTTQLIYELNPSTLAATSIAGVSGTAGDIGLNCNAASGTWASATADTSFYQMGGIALSPTHDRLIVIGKCSNNHHASVRSIALDSSVSPQVVHLAGNIATSAGSTLQDGVGNAARILNPRGLAVGASGESKNKYFFVDAENDKVGNLRVFDLSDNSITTVTSTSTSNCVSSQSSTLANLCLKGKIHSAHLGFMTGSTNGNSEVSKVSQGAYGQLVLTDKTDVYVVDPENLLAAHVHSINNNFFTVGVIPPQPTGTTNDDRFMYVFRRGNWDYYTEREAYSSQVRRVSFSLNDGRLGCPAQHGGPSSSADSSYSTVFSSTHSDIGLRTLVNVDGTIYGFPRYTGTANFNRYVSWDLDAATPPSFTQGSMAINSNEIGFDSKYAHVEAAVYASGFSHMILGFVEHGTTTVEATPLMNLRISDHKMRLFAGAKNVVGGSQGCSSTSINHASTTFMHTTGLAFGHAKNSLFALSRCNPDNTASIRAMSISHQTDATKTAGVVTVVAGHHTASAATAVPVDGVGSAATIANPFGLVAVLPTLYFLDAAIGSAPVVRSFNVYTGLVSTLSSSVATTAPTAAGIGFSVDRLHLTSPIVASSTALSSIWANNAGQPRLEGSTGSGEIVIVDGSDAFVFLPATSSVYKLDTTGLTLDGSAALGAAFISQDPHYTSVSSDIVTAHQVIFPTQASSTSSTTSSDQVRLQRVVIDYSLSSSSQLSGEPLATTSCAPRSSVMTDIDATMSNSVSIRTFCQVGTKGFVFPRRPTEQTAAPPAAFFTHDVTSTGGSISLTEQTMTGLNSNFRGFVSACHTVGSKLYIGLSTIGNSPAGEIYEMNTETYALTSVAGDQTGSNSGGSSTCDGTSWADAKSTTFRYVTGLSSSLDGKTLYVAGRCSASSGASIRAVDLTSSTFATTVVVGTQSSSSNVPTDGTGTGAVLVNPVHLVKMGNGDHFFLDGAREVYTSGQGFGTYIRKWVPSTGAVTTIDLKPSGMDLGRGNFNYLEGWPFMHKSCDCRKSELNDDTVTDDEAEVNLAASNTDAFELLVTTAHKIYALDVKNTVFHTFYTEPSGETFTAINVDRFGQAWSATQPSDNQYVIRKHSINLQAGNPNCHLGWAAIATETPSSEYTAVNYNGGNNIIEASVGGNPSDATGRIYASFNKKEIAVWSISSSSSTAGALASSTPMSTPFATGKIKRGFVMPNSPVIYAMQYSGTASIVRVDVSTSPATVETVTALASSDSTCSNSLPDTGSGFTLGSTRVPYATEVSVDGTHMVALTCSNIYRIDVSTTSGHNHVTSIEAGSGVKGIVDGIGAAAKNNAPRGLAQAATGIWYFLDIDNTNSDNLMSIRSFVPATSVSAVDGVVTTIASSHRWNLKTFDRAMNLFELPMDFYTSMSYSMERVGGNWLAISDASHVFLVDVSASDAHTTEGAAKAYTILEVDNTADQASAIMTVDFDTPNSMFVAQKALDGTTAIRHFNVAWNSVAGFEEPATASKKTALQGHQALEQRRRGLKL